MVTVAVFYPANTLFLLWNILRGAAGSGAMPRLEMVAADDSGTSGILGGITWNGTPARISCEELVARVFGDRRFLLVSATMHEYEEEQVCAELGIEYDAIEWKKVGSESWWRQPGGGEWRNDDPPDVRTIFAFLQENESFAKSLHAFMSAFVSA